MDYIFCMTFKHLKNKNRSGFSLIELLISITIIAIFLTVITSDFGQSKKMSRDAKRKTDLQNIQSALELYRNKYGRYPEGCRGYTTNTNIVWSGQKGTTFACSGNRDYIKDLAPEFIQRLPVDPLSVSGAHGYVYATNKEGSVYKIMTLDTVETENVNQNHSFFRCGDDYARGVGTGNSWEDPAICARSPRAVNTPATTPFDTCTNPNLYGKTYALSGGFSGDNRNNVVSPDLGREFDTEIVRCR